MSLVHVQKWFAHLTPEMTLAYAKLLDSTIRKEWEQAFAKGAVRIDVQGQPMVVSTEQLGNEQEIEWEHIRHNLDAVRLPNGYCFKPKKANCPTQDTPCYTCHHFCTTPDFLLQFEHEEQELRELIEVSCIIQPAKPCASTRQKKGQSAMRTDLSTKPNISGLLAHAQSKSQQGQERIERQWAERQQHQARTDRTKDVLLAAKDRRIKALEAENRQLKEDLKVAYGKLYDRL